MTALTRIYPSNRPVTVLTNGYYRQAPKDVLVSELQSGSEGLALAPDTSRYEFPGDRTYERYLTNRVGSA